MKPKKSSHNDNKKSQISTTKATKTKHLNPTYHMQILTINAGSSSIKYKIFDMPNHKPISQWKITNIQNDFQPKFEQILSQIQKIFPNIQAIGHRVVHGGEEAKAPQIITPQTIKIIEKYSPLAPLHNPSNKQGILICQKEFPKIPQIAIFDTSFHSDMPAEQYTYAIPRQLCQKHHIRKYGFHGISHEYVYNKILKLFPNKANKVISCHIWNWASITAIHNWQVIETSMGMSPLAWVMMWTRSGNIDPGVITYLMKKEKLSPDQMDDILYHQSWVFGVSGETNHMQTITQNYLQKDPEATLAFHMYINTIVKYIGSYIALLNGTDSIILTGWVIEKQWTESSLIRTKILEHFSYLNIQLNKQTNSNLRTDHTIITTIESSIPVIVIPTNEELLIAQKTYQIIQTSS